jgi:hypothetical protein
VPSPPRRTGRGPRSASAGASASSRWPGLRLDRRKRVGEVGGVAFGPAGQRVWVSTTDGLRRGLTRFSGRETVRIRLKRGAGAGLAISPDGNRAAVGAIRGARATAIVNLRRNRLRTRVRTGDGSAARRATTASASSTAASIGSPAATATTRRSPTSSTSSTPTASASGGELVVEAHPPGEHRPLGAGELLHVAV